MSNINLKTIDWNNLSVEDFSSLSEKLNSNLTKTKRPKIDDDKKFIIIKIDGQTFEISNSDYVRFKTLKSKKSKENFQNYVKKAYHPIIEL